MASSPSALTKKKTSTNLTIPRKSRREMSETNNHVLTVVEKDLYDTIRHYTANPRAYDVINEERTLHRLHVESIMIRIKAFLKVGGTFLFELPGFLNVSRKKYAV